VTSSRDDETVAAQRLSEASDAIVAGVARELPGWVQRSIARIADAWGRLDDDQRAALDRSAVDASTAAAERVTTELRALFVIDAGAQRATPLEIVRSAYREPTAALAAAGIAPVERDAFEERAWPDDCYGLVPHTLGDLGDPDLAPLHLAWGMAKSAVLRARANGRSDA
jgi:hypothetical protein